MDLGSDQALEALIEHLQQHPSQKQTHIPDTTRMRRVQTQEFAGAESCSTAGSQAAEDLRLAAETFVRTTATSKLLASEQKFGMVVKPSAAAEGIGETPAIVIMGHAPNHVQILTSSEASCMSNALYRSSTLSKHAEAFHMKVRVATTDKGKANPKTEEHFASSSSRGSGWSRLHLPCLVHVVATIHSRGLLELQSDISGLVNLSLCLAFGEMMAKFRSALARVLSKRVRFIRGTPPASALRFQQWALDMFCSSGPKSAVKRHLLSQLLNGNWMNHSIVEIYVAPGLTFEEKAAKPQIIMWVLTALAGRALRLYPQHRWLGADLAVADVALMEACHGPSAARSPQQTSCAPAATAPMDSGGV